MFWRIILWMYWIINIYYNFYDNVIKVVIMIKNHAGDFLIFA